MNLAFIPARGGSKRFPNKNLAMLGDQPLVAWPIEAAREAGCFSDIVVSTDSEKIARVAEEYDAIVSWREPKHATDTATVLDTVLHYLDTEARDYDKVAYLLPTCPLTPPYHILKCMSELENGSDFCISISRMRDPIQLAMKYVSEGRVVPVFDNLQANLTNSQVITPHFKPSGAVYAGQVRSAIAFRNFFSGIVKGVPLPEEYVIDIDTEEDLEEAKELINV